MSHQPLDKPAAKDFVTTVFYGATMSFASMALCVAVIMLVPAIGAIVWLAAILSLAAGVYVIHRRLPQHTYPIAVLFVPIVGALLIFIAIQVSWTILGGFI